MSDKDIDNALLLAEQSFKDWRTTSFSHRAKHLKNVATHIRSHKEKYARLITMEMGKILKEAIGEVEKCALVCDYYAEHAESFLKDEAIATDCKKSFVSFHSIGAVFGVMPWNFPFWQVFRYVAPTLMAGNVAFLKHAQNVTGCSKAIENILLESGLPKGVFQSLVIEHSQIEQVVKHDIVQAVTLTGSERAGASFSSLASKYIKKSVLELGGSDALLVFADADIDKAAQIAINSRMLNAGQSCIASKRFIVVKKVANEFMNAVHQKVSNIKQGNPLEETTHIGPMAKEEFAKELDLQVQRTVKEGGRLVCGGKYDRCNFQPTFISDVSKDMTSFNEELFGPVASLGVVENEDEAIEIANNSPYGLGGSIWSQDTEKAEHYARKINSGAVFINGLVRSDPRLPFGGIKRSGFGRELSHYGIKEFVNAKTIVIDN